MIIDPEIWNMDRLDTAASIVPSGQSYRTFVYYAQMMNDDRFSLYDYGESMNMKIYGSKLAPLVPIEDYKVPTVLMSGDKDPLADPIDVNWITQQLGSNVVFAKEYHLNHTGFVMANDMTFFSKDAVEQLHKFNPVSKSFDALFLN